MLAERAGELRARLEEVPRSDPRQRIAAGRAQRLRDDLAAQRRRLDASRQEHERLNRRRWRERKLLDERVARQEQLVAATERKIVEFDAAGEARQDPDRWVDRYAGELVEYLRIEGELGERFTAEYERAPRNVRINPARELADRLGERPRYGINRELWERQAVQLELHRVRHGGFTDRGDALRQLTAAHWRTAPREVARTAPNRPELPGAGRVLPEIGDDGLRLGP